MKGQVRYEIIRNLFYDNDWSQEINVTAGSIGATRMRKHVNAVEVALAAGETRKELYSAFIEQVKLEEKAAGFDTEQRDKHLLVNFKDRNHYCQLMANDGHSKKLQWRNP